MNMNGKFLYFEHNNLRILKNQQLHRLVPADDVYVVSGLRPGTDNPWIIKPRGCSDGCKFLSNHEMLKLACKNNFGFYNLKRCDYLGDALNAFENDQHGDQRASNPKPQARKKTFYQEYVEFQEIFKAEAFTKPPNEPNVTPRPRSPIINSDIDPLGSARMELERVMMDFDKSEWPKQRRRLASMFHTDKKAHLSVLKQAQYAEAMVLINTTLV